MSQKRSIHSINLIVRVDRRDAVRVMLPVLDLAIREAERAGGVADDRPQLVADTMRRFVDGRITRAEAARELEPLSMAADRPPYSAGWAVLGLHDAAESMVDTFFRSARSSDERRMRNAMIAVRSGAAHIIGARGNSENDAEAMVASAVRDGMGVDEDGEPLTRPVAAGGGGVAQRRSNPVRVAPRDVADLDVLLRAWTASNDSYALLDANKETSGSSWMQGGCPALAVALVAWFGPGAALAAVVGRSGAEHYLARVGRWYLDGDGVSRKESAVRRWRTRERVRGARLVDVSSVDVRRGMVCPRGLVREVVASLHERLGPAARYHLSDAPVTVPNPPRDGTWSVVWTSPATLRREVHTGGLTRERAGALSVVVSQLVAWTADDLAEVDPELRAADLSVAMVREPHDYPLQACAAAIASAQSAFRDLSAAARAARRPPLGGRVRSPDAAARAVGLAAARLAAARATCRCGAG